MYLFVKEKMRTNRGKISKLKINKTLYFLSRGLEIKITSLCFSVDTRRFKEFDFVNIEVLA